MPATKKAPKPLRKDAANNRARLIASGRIVLAERGLSVTLDEIARHAGVGVATAYRHFANKQELASVVLGDAIADLAQDAENACLIADPWEAFSGFFQTVVQKQTRHRGLHLISAHDGVAPAETRKRLANAVARLFDRAKRAGVIRPDAEATDIGPILVMMRTIIDANVTSPANLWKRYLALFLDGLRATDRPLLPTRALTMVEFEAFASNRR